VCVHIYIYIYISSLPFSVYKALISYSSCVLYAGIVLQINKGHQSS